MSVHLPVEHFVCLVMFGFADLLGVQDASDLRGLGVARLRNTVSKITRRPGASQYVTRVCWRNRWNLNSRTFPPR
jgi:hypothetical protein